MDDKLTNGDVIIRDATEDDMSLVVEMTQELANFQNMPNGPKITSKELRQDGFESKWPLFRCKIAEVQTTGMVIGFAIYYPIYSTWEGKAMWLQNLFVKESYRQRGVGRILFGTAVTPSTVSDKVNKYNKGNVRMRVHELFHGQVQITTLVYYREEAIESGCGRLDFKVLAWNPARVFYNAVGARNLTECHGAYCYSLSGEDFKSLASKTPTVKKLKQCQ